MEPTIEKAQPAPQKGNATADLVAKFISVARGPDGDLLLNLLDVLYERIGEEYDREPLSPEEIEMIAASDGQFARGEYLTLEEYRSGKRL
jgi:hypothetical protein